MRMIILGLALLTASAAPTLAASDKAVANSNSTSVAGSKSGVVGSGNSAITVNGNSPYSYSRNSASLRTPPTVVAPGLAAAGIESCLGSVSAGASWMGGGVSFGSSVTDHGCDRRLYARTMQSFGYKAAAVAMICLDPEVRQAMTAAGTPCPQDILSTEAVHASLQPVAIVPVPATGPELRPHQGAVQARLHVTDDRYATVFGE